MAVADFDGDGKLDVYIASLREASRLYRGNGDGTFNDVTARAGVRARGPARSCAWTDVDRDGWPDLYVTNPKGGCYLFKNNRDGTFTDIVKDSGIDLPGRHCLGCGFGDIDGDGRDDLFVTCYQSQASASSRTSATASSRTSANPASIARRRRSVASSPTCSTRAGSTCSSRPTPGYPAPTTRRPSCSNKHTVVPNVLYANDGKGKLHTEGADPRVQDAVPRHCV